MRSPWHHDPRIVIEEFCKIVRYDHDNGNFFWKMNRYGRGGSRAGMVAGFINENGYRCFRIKGKKFYAHRLAWLFIHKQWPHGIIDHINGNRSDNRICNLREVTNSKEEAHNAYIIARRNLHGEFSA